MKIPFLKIIVIAELNVYTTATQDSHLKRDSFRKSDIQFTETSFKSWF